MSVLCLAAALIFQPNAAAAKKKKHKPNPYAVQIITDDSAAPETSPSELKDENKYLLYLPPGLETGKKYPLVIALSPAGNAQSILNAWRQVADKHKWIVFASKVFRNNGDMEQMLASVSDSVYMEVCPAGRADCDKVIATGMSGGAMGSHTLAFMRPALVSAIVLNTGMMHEYYAGPGVEFPKNKLAVFLASPTDFRYEAMEKDREFLENRGWKTEWIEFEGGHIVAPPSVYEQAAQWLEKNMLNSTPKGTDK